jgi:hypothetical protein
MAPDTRVLFAGIYPIFVTVLPKHSLTAIYLKNIIILSYLNKYHKLGGLTQHKFIVSQFQ